MKKNVDNIDRSIRIIMAIILFGASYLSYIKDTSIFIGALLILIGVVSMITGIIGFCALYSMLNISTAKN